MGIDDRKREGAPGEIPVYPRPRLIPSRRRGQILIPSLLIIPSLLLFVYLLFETSKVSREKIRQQFAVDSAAFIQMGDYTNLLNRTAYVDGAFPYRIFKEAYECPPEKPLSLADGSVEQICPYDMLYAAGAFPKYGSRRKGQVGNSVRPGQGGIRLQPGLYGLHPAFRPDHVGPGHEDNDRMGRGHRIL
jgi:hypothetical protein